MICLCMERNNAKKITTCMPQPCSLSTRMAGNMHLGRTKNGIYTLVHWSFLVARWVEEWKKLDRGVKTAPAAFQIRRRTFSPGRENPRTPAPPLHGGFPSLKWALGRCPPSALVMGTGEGIFLTSAWNSLPRGVELRTWGVPPGHLTVWARRP